MCYSLVGFTPKPVAASRQARKLASTRLFARRAALLAQPGSSNTNYSVARLDGGMTSLTSLIESQHDLDAIHLVSHGSAGELWLGGEALDAAAAWRYADDLRAWGAALKPGGD